MDKNIRNQFTDFSVPDYNDNFYYHDNKQCK